MRTEELRGTVPTDVIHACFWQTWYLFCVYDQHYKREIWRSEDDDHENFDVLLTVHLSVFIVLLTVHLSVFISLFNQLDAQNFVLQ